jgi:hypothetical protein
MLVLDVDMLEGHMRVKDNLGGQTNEESTEQTTVRHASQYAMLDVDMLEGHMRVKDNLSGQTNEESTEQTTVRLHTERPPTPHMHRGCHCHIEAGWLLA